MGEHWLPLQAFADFPDALVAVVTVCIAALDPSDGAV